LLSQVENKEEKTWKVHFFSVRSTQNKVLSEDPTIFQISLTWQVLVVVFRCISGADSKIAQWLAANREEYYFFPRFDQKFERKLASLAPWHQLSKSRSAAVNKPSKSIYVVDSRKPRSSVRHFSGTCMCLKVRRKNILLFKLIDLNCDNFFLIFLQTIMMYTCCILIQVTPKGQIRFMFYFSQFPDGNKQQK